VAEGAPVVARREAAPRRELLAEHGRAPVADPFRDLLDRQARGFQQFLGLTAPGCVEGTGRWATELGYAVTLVKDATASFTKEWMHAAVELNGPLYAEVLTTAEVIDGING